MTSSENNSPQIGQLYRFIGKTHLQGTIFLVTKNIYNSKILYGLVPLSSRYLGNSWSTLTLNIDEIFGTHEKYFELIK
jgi:hypothetical protein